MFTWEGKGIDFLEPLLEFLLYFAGLVFSWMEDLREPSDELDELMVGSWCYYCVFSLGVPSGI